MDTKATATLRNGQKISGRLTTAHPASSYCQPVFVDDDGQAYNWSDIIDVKTTEGQSKGGKAGTQAQNAARAANAKKGGYPKGKPRKPKTQPTKRGADSLKAGALCPPSCQINK